MSVQDRSAIRAAYLEPDVDVLSRLAADHPIQSDIRAAASSRAIDLVSDIRAEDRGGLMEVFLAEYGLSSTEGLALMRLAEALLRVPDDHTVDALIEDKIVPAEWSAHRGRSDSTLVNASTLALMLTGRVLSDEDGEGLSGTLKGAIKRLGEPVIRAATRRAMKEMGNQFVLGETIAEAVARGRPRAAQGYTFSYDMLGEAALTAAEATAFYSAYSEAIAYLSKRSDSEDIRRNPGISVKLSALHPRFEQGQRDRVLTELAPRLLKLCRQAKSAGMGLNIDAEEADRLDLSLDVIEMVLADQSLVGWDGFGVVVQAYGKRAAPVIDWLYALSDRLDRKIMVRLVKGAYWDTEIKRAQVAGLVDFPVFAEKAATDVSYLSCAQSLLKKSARIYPQFATHNAHSVAAVMELAADLGVSAEAYEFQRLHGMGEALYDVLKRRNAVRCRIYAPVGAHRDLLAYLVRRLLENGANSSFVHKIMDDEVSPEDVAADPFELLGQGAGVTTPGDLYAPERDNSMGRDLTDPTAHAALNDAREPFKNTTWQSEPLIAGRISPSNSVIIRNPANHNDTVGQVQLADSADVETALAASTPWPAPNRANVLNRAADLYEANAPEIFALLAREAGKTLPDCEAELREAVDFLRYYAARIPELSGAPLGRITCISPWNFPLAIFTGQISAALAAGNAVLAKPAETTPLIATFAVKLLHNAGVPKSALQLLPGEGRTVGAALTSDPRIDGVAFTGSTKTAQIIHRAMAANLAPSAPLIAETGGLNAMIVDSTALPEQAVRDVIVSAFQSAGQRCSALRCLYVQTDIAKPFIKALTGAMDELAIGSPWPLSTDVGPVIDAVAHAKIRTHIEAARKAGHLLHETGSPGTGTFIPPTLLRVSSISDLKEEIFGPVLHIATFKANEFEAVIDTINATGYGLTFGLQSRIDERAAYVAEHVDAGNVYINRNQIGAIVGSQPFGGHGLSGTGPKAGGPAYVSRFTNAPSMPQGGNLPGPTGETNRLTTHPKGPVLCLGPTPQDAAMQARQAEEIGCPAIQAPSAESIPCDITAALFWGSAEQARAYRQALAAADGPIVPLITAKDPAPYLSLERHTCVDTTAAGGNAALLASVA